MDLQSGAREMLQDSDTSITDLQINRKMPTGTIFAVHSLKSWMCDLFVPILSPVWWKLCTCDTKTTVPKNVLNILEALRRKLILHEELSLNSRDGIPVRLESLLVRWSVFEGCIRGSELRKRLSASCCDSTSFLAEIAAAWRRARFASSWTMEEYWTEPRNLQRVSEQPRDERHLSTHWVEAALAWAVSWCVPTPAEICQFVASWTQSWNLAFSFSF